MHDIVKISEELAFINSYGSNTRGQKELLEMEVIDYALRQAVLKNTTLLEEIETIRLMNLDSIDRIHRNWFVGPADIYKIYLKFRYVSGVMYMNIRNWYINEMGFTEELCKILEQYCKHGSPLAENVLRHITRDELKSITNNNQKLIDLFNRQMENIGLKWIKLVDGVERLDTVTYGSQKYIEIDVEKAVKQEIKGNNVETKTKLVKHEFNPMLEQPFKSEAFKSMPKEFQEWMKIGYMQQAKQQTESKLPNRLIEQVVYDIQHPHTIDVTSTVYIKPKKTKTKQVKNQDVFKVVQDDLGLIYNLEDEFITNNQDDLWECIIKGEGNAKTKRELLRYIDNVCNKKQI